MPRRRSRRRARQLSGLRQGAARHARVLRGEGQPGAGGAGAAGLAGLVLRHRLGRRDRDGARRRRHGRPHLLWQHDQEGARHRARLSRSASACSRSIASAEVEKIARAAPGARVFCRILSDGAGAEWPLSRKFGCEPAMAVDVLEHAHQARPGAVWRLVPCRFAAAQPARLGPRARLGGGGVPRLRRARHQPVDGQPGRRLPDQVPEGRAVGRRPTARRSSARCASISATASRRPSSSRAAAWSAMPASIEAEVVLSRRRATRTTCAGSISTSASSAVSPRRWTSRSATRSARRATATRWRRACSPARPAIRPTCCTRRSPIRCRSALEIGDKVLIEGTGAYTTTYSSVAFNGFPPLKTYHI